MENSQNKNDDVNDPYRIVMDAIVTQKLTPSQKVSENILSDMFGISRTIARNLIERLVAQQFLVSPSPRITQVAPLTLFEIRQNFTLRKILLPEVISMAGSKVDFPLLSELNEKIQGLLPIINDESALELLKINKQVNLAIYKSVGYPLIYEWATQLEDTTMRIYWLYLKSTQSFPYSNDQQNNFLELLKSDDAKRIELFVIDMISLAEERVLNCIFSNKQFDTKDLII